MMLAAGATGLLPSHVAPSVPVCAAAVAAACMLLVVELGVSAAAFAAADASVVTLLPASGSTALSAPGELVLLLSGLVVLRCCILLLPGVLAACLPVVCSASSWISLPKACDLIRLAACCRVLALGAAAWLLGLGSEEACSLWVEPGLLLGLELVATVSGEAPKLRSCAGIIANDASLPWCSSLLASIGTA